MRMEWVTYVPENTKYLLTYSLTVELDVLTPIMKKPTITYDAEEKN
jgi:hypothetical protein